MLRSLLDSEKVETTNLNEMADKVDELQNATATIREYETIICTMKRNIMCLVYHQGKVIKRFKEKEKFAAMVGEFKVNKSTEAALQRCS